MKRILLVAPLPLKFELTQDDSYLRVPLIRAKSFMVPLHIATIAALTPDEYEVDLWDESVQGRMKEESVVKDYDLVGITGYTAHLPRAKEIAQLFRKAGVPVAIGGAGISTIPKRHRDAFDIIFLGEAELTWPRFLSEWKEGNHRRVYRQVTSVDLSLSPVPRWNNLVAQIHNYLLGGVQTSRGCPYDCDFCDVSYLFGRRFRHKPIEKVLEEISALEGLGVRNIVFCDDNFVGNPGYTKRLLREVISLNNSFRRPLGFTTEASIDVAGDEEMLELLADANVVQLFIGIESPNRESLKEANKIQNLRADLIADIKKIQSYGISVRGSLIVGFDHDDEGIFDQHFQFVQESGVAVPSIRVLMAPPGTRLWKRLLKEGRILKTETEGRFFGNPGTTNIIPKKMARTELHSAYLKLIERVYDWQNFSTRMKVFLSNIQRRPRVPRQAGQWKRLVPFIYFIFSSLDYRARRAVLGIVWHTFMRAPYMLPRVIGVIVRQFGYAVRPKLREAIQEQIELERAGALSLELEKPYCLVPDFFKEHYEAIFPEVHQEVSKNLVDQSRTEETLIEIFTEFLSHRRQSFASFSAEQREDLVGLTKAIIAEKNRTLGAGNGLPSSGYVFPKSERLHLSSQILKAVEQELSIAEI
jgi:radical SAM superfamily enzyme YgiQ (UPF0313 family)